MRREKRKYVLGINLKYRGFIPPKKPKWEIKTSKKGFKAILKVFEERKHQISLSTSRNKHGKRINDVNRSPDFSKIQNFFEEQALAHSHPREGPPEKIDIPERLIDHSSQSYEDLGFVYIDKIIQQRNLNEK